MTEEEKKIREDIWDTLLNEILLDDKEFKIFTDAQWRWLKKRVFKLTQS